MKECFYSALTIGITLGINLKAQSTSLSGGNLGKYHDDLQESAQQQLVEFENELDKVQDFKKNTDHSRQIHGIHLKLINQ